MKLLTPTKQHLRVTYKTKKGTMYCGFTEDFLDSSLSKKYLGKVQMIFTSPPFPLNRKKKYGNRNGDEYIKWLAAFAPKFCSRVSWHRSR